MNKLLVLISMLFAFTGVQASDYWQSNQNNVVVVDVVDDNGRILNQYTANSNGYKPNRSYLEAIKNKRYKIRLRNTSNHKVGVVVTVDGRNILSGKKSYLRNNERMYVLDPHESSDYTGWRTAKNTVNRFYFTSAGDSYSNAWGDRSAMGVIAVAVFKEKYQRPNYQDRRYNKSAPSSNSLSADESTGTGFGREEYSPTTSVKFVAENHPILKRFIKYEWRTGLCKRGVINCDYYDDESDNRFWPIEVNNGYVPYPPAYRKHRSYRPKNRHKNRHHRDRRNTRSNERILWSDQFTAGRGVDFERLR